MTNRDDAQRSYELAALRQTSRRLQSELESLNDRIVRLENLMAKDQQTAAQAQPQFFPATEHPPTEPAETELPPIATPAIPPLERATPVTTDWLERHSKQIQEHSEQAATPSTPASPPERPSPSKPAGTMELAIGKTWLNRIGALALLAATIFFIKYSFDQGWISPTTRVVLGAITGLAMIVGGEYCLYRRMRTFAGGILGCGVGILYISAFGAYNHYQLVSPSVAGVLYTAVTVISVAVALHGRLLAVAILAVIGGYGTPIALSTGENRQIALLTYVMFLDIGFLLSATLRRWDVLRNLAWLGTLGLFGCWFVEFYEPSVLWTTWGFMLGFYLLFHAEAIVSIRRKALAWPRALGGFLTLNNAVFFACTYFLWRGDYSAWLGLFAVAMAMLQWLIAWKLLPKEGTPENARLAFWLAGAAMLSLAAPLQFDRYMVSISWIVQALVTFWFCRRNDATWLRFKGSVLLIAAVEHILMYECRDNLLIEHFVEIGQWHAGWLTVLFIGAGLAFYIASALLALGRSGKDLDRKLAPTLTIAGTALLLYFFGDQWERSIATWWWLGLAACWLLLAIKLPRVGLIALGIVLATSVKYFFDDTLSIAVTGEWSNLQGVFSNRTSTTGFIVAAAVFVAYWQARRMAIDDESSRTLAGIRSFFLVVVALLTFWVPTFELVRVFHHEPIRLRFEDTRLAMHVALSIWWSLHATACLIVGFVRHKPPLRYFALTLYLVTIAKVFLFDLSQLDMIYRIVSFLVLGVMLLFASLLYQKLQAQITAAASPDEQGSESTHRDNP